MKRNSAEIGLVLIAVAAFSAMLLGNLGHPLFWSDEADTAMFGTRVLEYGYPKVHGPDNVVYQFGPDVALGIKERFDAYIGTTWGHFYFAVPGLWWAEAVADPWAKTARVRLPFALAGALGLGLWLAAVLPALGPGSGRRLRFAALFFALAAVSVSLLLHLREARYYALVVLLGGAIARVQLRRTVYATLSARRYALELTALHFLLFHTFFAAWFSWSALLAGERVVVVWRRRAPLLRTCCPSSSPPPSWRPSSSSSRPSTWPESSRATSGSGRAPGPRTSPRSARISCATRCWGPRSPAARRWRGAAAGARPADGSRRG